MSDIFDHEADAYDDLFFGRTADGDDYPRRSYSSIPRRPTCRRCGKAQLKWKFDTAIQKWIICESDWSHHRCMLFNKEPE